jgi:hypothetical protein
MPGDGCPSQNVALNSQIILSFTFQQNADSFGPNKLFCISIRSLPSTSSDTLRYILRLSLDHMPIVAENLKTHV